MKFSEEQTIKMKQHMDEIYKYIKEEILPYINYDFETPVFGPIEKWGRFDENRGQRYTIKLNHHNTDIEFCHGGIPFFIGDYFPEEYMYNILEYWHDVKNLLNAEIANQIKKENIIENFKI